MNCSWITWFIKILLLYAVEKCVYNIIPLETGFQPYCMKLLYWKSRFLHSVLKCHVTWCLLVFYWLTECVVLLIFYLLLSLFLLSCVFSLKNISVANTLLRNSYTIYPQAPGVEISVSQAFYYNFILPASIYLSLLLLSIFIPNLSFTHNDRFPRNVCS